MTLLRLAGMCGLLLVAASLASAAEPGAATVSLFDRAPKMDGRIAPGEWNGAMRIQGFQRHRGAVADKVGASWLGYTKDRLYIAVATELPPDQTLKALEMKEKAGDDKLYGAGGIELWLDANRGRRDETKSKLPYVQFIGNATGAIFDKRYGVPGEPPSRGWDGDWEFVNEIHTNVSEDAPIDAEHGIWVAEISISFDELGLEKDPVGRTIGALIVRNWKRKRGGQMSWFPKGGFYSDWNGYPDIRLTKDEPSVQIMSLGEDFYEGHLDLKARIFNPTDQQRTVKVQAKASSSNMPSVEGGKTLKLKPNGLTPYSFKADTFHANAQHELHLVVQDKSSDTKHLDYRMKWQKPKRSKWRQKRTGPDPEAAVTLDYYPSYGFFRITADPRELGKKPGQITTANVTAVGPKGEKITDETMQWDGPSGKQRFQIGDDLKPGQYTVKVNLDGYEKTLKRSFQRKYFVWEGNRLGITNKVYPPFEPVETDGKKVSVVMREYEHDGLGLWKSVKARGNGRNDQMRELLAGPAAIRVNGGQRIEGDGKVAESGKQRVIYQGSASHPAVNVATRCTTHYDGAMKVELTLKPGAKEEQLDKLWLDIPVREEAAPLFHATTTGLRNNPAGKTPNGDGVVWDSRELTSSGWYGNFLPYLWVGAEERGLCWFADNDKGWTLDVDDNEPEQSTPCQQLIRKDGKLILRVNLVQKPVTIDEQRKITFGLMATPGKPMPDNWRNVFFRNKPADNARVILWMAAQYWGSPSVMYSKLPVDQDTDVLSKLQERRLGGGGWGQFLKAWEQKHLTGDISDKTYKSKKKILGLLNHAGRISRGADDYLTAYWEEFHATHAFHPEDDVFGDEWASHAYPESYLNFAAWAGAEFIRRGIGLYFDNAFPKITKDPVTTAAYELPNGRIQPSANMWRHRRYLRRIWVLHQQLAPAATKPIMMQHMTNTHIPPYMVYNQSNLDLEWLYGKGAAQAKYPPDLLRTESTGLQSGNIPTSLAKGSHRTRFGAMMVHEIRAVHFKGSGRELLSAMGEFGYTQPDAEVYNYWDDDAPLSVSDDKCKWLLIKHHGELMALLCTWNPQKKQVRVTVDADAAGVDVGKAINVETDEAQKLKGGAFTFSMPGHGVRLFHIK